ncbi:DUF308 domain-containing protein [Bradyrhizobium sp. CB1015]|uniref:DUF308 domain-containing protein n=1 Tax=Bradyrhizobium sp. CB1015 TaxID=2976822 RepID=UPI0021AA6983|nr:DUF308 domain-containing protein [Bradyrhizobium sp. CB1015]UWU95253.1 DUF308 domain-containing protein [Bradyrhizobium sp. CB1015]
MNLALLIVGICAALAGLLAIIFGMTIREFSLGGTLIISGTIGVCSGMLLVGLHLVLLELKGIARRLAGAVAPSEVRVRPVLPGLAVPGSVAPEPMPAAAVRAEPAPPPPPPSPPPSPPPWQSEAAARERPRTEAPQQEPEAPTAPEAPRRRNLLFASTSRKERERAEAKSGEAAPPPADATEAPNLPPASFDVAWPKPDRTRPPEPPAAPRRPPPRSPTFAETAPAPAPEPPPAVESAPPVTVLKSGVVDGMAYSLYSDGSIEAQMPEGMMRFASIDELRAHLDQRG